MMMMYPLGWTCTHWGISNDDDVPFGVDCTPWVDVPHLRWTCTTWRTAGVGAVPLGGVPELI